jgi:hypothetical protein
MAYYFNYSKHYQIISDAVASPHLFKNVVLP